MISDWMTTCSDARSAVGGFNISYMYQYSSSWTASLVRSTRMVKAGGTRVGCARKSALERAHVIGMVVKESPSRLPSAIVVLDAPAVLRLHGAYMAEQCLDLTVPGPAGIQYLPGPETAIFGG
jgi:hypothetical protein